MIVFDLLCGQAHVFEAWFGSSDDYESQRARGLIACPLCGDGGISKAVMAPAVGAKGNRAASAVSPSGRAEMLAAQRAMEAASDYVGGNFAVAARARFGDAERAKNAGDAPVRGIYGEATIDEARALAEDGIAVMPLPFTPLVRSDA
ncbi:hypothetical protein GCM10011529_26540 [Polymorphobacter glacialis]|uniref:DUF1178 family protein n=1 Tax=Sandarakinorhabdus glacialis TaxID=1614636 RepID=A0A916ZYN7_9SPHN|nr:DUF1178 family protein [Polymorphobacter glacialis]GGE18769.1 hypothetical protein GCM10011529_26540 [Polymorphobacter glacialis]